MRRLLLAAVSAASVLVIVGPAAAAAGIQDRYCLQGRIWGYPGNCAFSTLAQCAASASGTYASCGLNPMATTGPAPRKRGRS
jgi:Protein of unknown function (DUF3551)